MITKGEVVEGKYAKKLIAYYVNPCLSYHYVYIGEKELSLPNIPVYTYVLSIGHRVTFKG